MIDNFYLIPMPGGMLAVHDAPTKDGVTVDELVAMKTPEEGMAAIAKRGMAADLFAHWVTEFKSLNGGN